MTAAPLVALIVVVWNNLGDTLECLESLASLRYPQYHVIVVDNGSTDGTADQVKESFPSVLVVRSDQNLGYAGGCNLGLQHACQELDAAYCLILNNDTKVCEEDFLESLVHAAEQDETIGVVAPLVCDYHSPQSIQCAGVRVNLYAGRARPLTEVGEKPIWTDAVHGCAFMIKRQVIDEVGGLDEQFYLYWEETDYCLRAKRAGYRVLIDAETYILHKSGSTIGGRQELYTYYVFRNRLLLMKKHARVAQWLTLAPLLPAYALVHIIRGWGEGNAPWAAAVAIKEACQDFSAGAFGKKRV